MKFLIFSAARLVLPPQNTCFGCFVKYTHEVKINVSSKICIQSLYSFLVILVTLVLSTVLLPFWSIISFSKSDVKRVKNIANNLPIFSFAVSFATEEIPLLNGLILGNERSDCQEKCVHKCPT